MPASTPSRPGSSPSSFPALKAGPSGARSWQNVTTRPSRGFREWSFPWIRSGPKGGGGHVYHQYTLRVSGEGRRDRLRGALTDRSIGSEVYYPIPLHRQKAFSDNPTIHGPLAVSEALSREVVSLPVFPELTDPEQERVIEAVRDILSS